jgi:hypothetical protein
MKNLSFFSLFLSALLLAGCGSGKPVSSDQPSSPNLVKSGKEEAEYELTIIDPDFDRWCSINCRPANYHSLEFYEGQNQRYVSAWNALAARPSASPGYPFQNHIEYSPNIDYGLDLNYRLYWYFKYVESTVGRRYGFP